MPVVSEEIMAAEVKYKNNPDLISRDLARLRVWLPTQKHLPEVPDEVLLQIHHSCYFDLETTQNCIENYYTLRTNIPEIFTNRDVRRPEFVKALEGVHCAVFGPDHRGYYAIYSGLRQLEPSKFFQQESSKLYTMTEEALVARLGTPVAGFVHIQNMQGMKIGHVARCSRSLAKKCSPYMQNGNPIRVKEVHIINVGPWIDKLLSLVKPFTMKEQLKLVHLHRTNSTALFDFWPKTLLPLELGGTLPSIEVLHAENVKHLENMVDFFREEEKSRVDETKREKKNKKKKNDSETEILFENLLID